MECCAVIRLSDGEVVLFKETNIQQAQAQRENLNHILSFALECVDEEHMNTAVGIWYMKKLGQWLGLVLCQRSYPESQALACLSDMVSLMNQQDPREKQIDKNITLRIYGLLSTFHKSSSAVQQHVLSSSQNLIKTNYYKSNITASAAGNSKLEGGGELGTSTAHTLGNNTDENVSLPQFVCYGFLLLCAFLLVILMVIKLS